MPTEIESVEKLGEFVAQPRQGHRSWDVIDIGHAAAPAPERDAVHRSEVQRCADERVATFVQRHSPRVAVIKRRGKNHTQIVGG